MAVKFLSPVLMTVICIFYQCSRTCGEGVQYRQVECMRKFRDGTEMHASDCDINEVSDLIRPCHNQPCGKLYVFFCIIFGMKCGICSFHNW